MGWQIATRVRRPEQCFRAATHGWTGNCGRRAQCWHFARNSRDLAAILFPPENG